MARFRAASKVALEVEPIAPKLTPTAKPSVILLNFWLFLTSSKIEIKYLEYCEL
jgi:hypothetical protein